MNAEAGQGSFRKLAHQEVVPRQARRAAPAASRAVSQGPGRIIFAGTQVAQAGQPGGVFELGIRGGLFSPRSEQPGWGNEPARG